LAWALLLFVSAPLVYAWFMLTELDRGSFPPEADAIAIPIVGSVFVTVGTAPFTWGIVWYCTREYRPCQSLLGWNAAHGIWSLTWTITLGVAAIAFLIAGIDFLLGLYKPIAIHAFLDVWMLAVLRASIIKSYGAE